MPYKDSAKQREAVKKAVQKRRTGITKGITSGGITDQGITSIRPIIHALADPERRVKLRLICESLKRRRLLDMVNYGCGVDPTPITEVDQLLTAFD
jgi:hypothetical protein